MDDQLQSTSAVNESTPPPPTIDPALQPTPVVESASPPPSSPTTPSKWYKNVWVLVGIAAVVIAIIGAVALWMSGFFASSTKTANTTPTPTLTSTPTATPSPTTTVTATPTPSPTTATTVWKSPESSISLRYPSVWTVKTIDQNAGMPELYTYEFYFEDQKTFKLSRAPFGMTGPVEDDSISQNEIRRIATGQLTTTAYYNYKAENDWWAAFTVNDDFDNAVTITIPKDVINDQFVKDVLATVSGLKKQIFPLENLIAD